jgi:hypothetical protein
VWKLEIKGLTGTPFDFDIAFFQNCSPLSVFSSCFFGLSNVIVVVGSSTFSLNEALSLLNLSAVTLEVFGLYELRNDDGGDFSFTFGSFKLPLIEAVRSGGLTDEVVDEMPDDLLLGEIDEIELGELIPL